MKIFNVVTKVRGDFAIAQVMDAWVAYAPVKNNPEDAAKVVFYYQLLKNQQTWSLKLLETYD